MGTLRALAFLVLSAWIFGGPCYRQVLGGHSPYFNRWAMYSRPTPDLIEVRYAADAAGRQPLPYYRMLGYAGPGDAPKSVRRITSLTRAVRIGRRLCDVGGPGTSVYLRARKSAPSGFVVVAAGVQDLCVRTRDARAHRMHGS